MVLGELLCEIQPVVFLDGGPHLVELVNLAAWRFSLLRRRYSWLFLEGGGGIEGQVVVEYFFDGLLEVFDASVDAIAFVVEGEGQFEFVLAALGRKYNEMVCWLDEESSVSKEDSFYFASFRRFSRCSRINEWQC